MLLQVGRAVPTTPWELVLTSSRETKFVLAILVVFSLVSWYLIFLKWWQFRRMRRQADRFMTQIEKSARLEDAYHAAMRLPSSPYNRLRREGIDAVGPFPADTLFHAAARKRYDAVLCMYHDQALIPIKTVDFDGGVNVTLGLPFIRTSPDHGTAFDIAGKGIANPTSLIAALKLASEMAMRRAGFRASAA